MPPPTDEEYDRANRDFEFLLSEVLLVGTEAVGDEAAKVLEAFSRVGGQMRRFDGGTAARFSAAFREHDRAKSARAAARAELNPRAGSPQRPRSVTAGTAVRGARRAFLTRLGPLGDTGRAMSQENAELTHQAYDAFNRRDSAAFVELMDADVEASSRLAAMEGGYHGHDGIRRWWKNLLDAIPDFTIEVIEVRELGDVTLTKMHTSGHGADSGSPLEETAWVAVEWRDKKVVWWGIFATEAEALEAVGLSGSS